jgi:hypothetical protein
MSDAPTGSTSESSALSPAPVSGGRRRRMSRKLRATKKKISQLKKYAKKLGGAADSVEKAADVAEDKVEDAESEVMGARRRRSRKTKKGGKSRRSLFGLKY